MSSPSSFHHQFAKSITFLIRSILILLAPLISIGAVFLLERLFISRHWHYTLYFLNIPLIMILFFVGFLILEIARLRKLDQQLKPHDQQDQLALARLNRQRLISDMQLRCQAYFAQTLRFDQLAPAPTNNPADPSAYPFELTLWRPDQTPMLLPQASDLTELFEQQRGQLLILGELGSGKTYLLYQLAKLLLARASADQRHEVPVLLSLRSWQPNLSLYDWIVKELSQRFLTSSEAIEELLQTESIVLLFDGLDEIDDIETRIACIAALQRYRSEHAQLAAHFVIAALDQDYHSIPELAAYSALVLLSLTASQVDQYLADPAFQPLRQAIAQHANLAELLRSPFFLSLAAHTYSNRAPDLPADADRASLAKHLIDDYIANACKQTKPLPATHLRAFLAWFAHALSLPYQQSPFYLENLRTDSLPSAKRSWLSRILFGLGSGVVVALIVVVLMFLILDPILGSMPAYEPLLENGGGGQRRSVRISFLLARPLGLFTAAVVALYTIFFNPDLFKRFAWSRSKGEKTLGKPIVRALGVGFAIALIFTLLINVFTSFWIALLFGAFSGLMLGMASFSSFPQIEPKRSEAQNIPSSKRSKPRKRKNLVMNLLGVVLILLFSVIGFFFGRQLGAMMGLACGLVMFVLFRLLRSFGGFTKLTAAYQIEPLQLRQNPNQALFHLARKAWQAGLINGVLYGIFLGVLFALFGLSIGLFTFSVTLSYGFALDALLNLFKTVAVLLSYGLTIGLYLGLIVGALQSGALAILQHYLLRRMLAKRVGLRSKLGTAFEQARDCGLLMQIGGAYAFQHVLLEHHFAHLSDPSVLDVNSPHIYQL